MNKLNSIISGILIIILFSACSQSSKNDLQLFSYKGNVKSCISKDFNTIKKFGEWKEAGLNRSYVIKFDEKGNYTEIENFDFMNELTSKIIPKRINGKITEENTYNKQGNLETSLKIKSISENEFNTESYNAENIKVSSGTIYRENGKNTKKVTNILSEKKDSTTIINWEYDAKGLLSTINISNEKGEIRISQKYKYTEFDKQNNWTKVLIYNMDSEDVPVFITTREIEYY